MKRLVFTIILLAVIACPVLAQPKIGVVDMNKVFDNYYKTKSAKQTLKDYTSDLEKAGQDMVNELKKLNEDYTKALAASSDQAVSASEREKSKKLAESKFKEAQEKDQAIQTYQRQAEGRLSEKRRQLFEKIVEEIRTVVNAEATAAGCTLVLDATAETPGGTPIVLYQNGSNDLTGPVLTRLNVAAPLATAPVEDDKKKK
jgi:outer membrane protein